MTISAPANTRSSRSRGGKRLPFVAGLRDPSGMPDAENDVTLRLTADEALVLFDWVHRCEDEGEVVQPVHDGERTALFNLSALLGARACGAVPGQLLRVG